MAFFSHRFRRLFSETPVYFWALCPFVLVFAILMAIGRPEDTPTQRAGSMVVALLAVLLLLGLASPLRFRWAARMVTGAVFLIYLAFVCLEAWRAIQLRSVAGTSLVLALVGMLVWGIPALVFALSGAFPSEHRESEQAGESVPPSV